MGIDENSVSKKRRRGTLASIAAELGISRTSVSNAYNRPDQLSDELRERILATAEKLGYAGPDPMARSLRTRKVGAMGVLFTEQLAFAFEDPASTEFLAGLSEVLGERGESMVVIPAASATSAEGTGDSQDTQAQQAQHMIRRALVDKFVVYSVAENDPFLRTVMERELPTVICDQPTNVPELPFVGIDDREAIKPAVRHLLELGHRKFGVLSVRLSRLRNDGAVEADRLLNAQHHVQKSRVIGVLEALAEAGINADEVPIIERHLNNRVSNVDAARELLEAHPDLTAIVCTTDTQALGVMTYCRDHDISIPGDVSVTGFDGIALARVLGVTTVVQPNREKGRIAGQMLLDAAEDSSAALDTPPQRTILDTEFVVGKTTATPRD